LLAEKAGATALFCRVAVETIWGRWKVSCDVLTVHTNCRNQDILLNDGFLKQIYTLYDYYTQIPSTSGNVYTTILYKYLSLGSILGPS